MLSVVPAILAVKPLYAFAISGVRFFRVMEVAKVVLFAAHYCLCEPLVHVPDPVDALETGSVVALLPTIELVLRPRCQPQIADGVVGRIAVLVVNLSIWPLAINVEPSKLWARYFFP